MLCKMLVSAADALGRSLRAGAEYDLDQEMAEGFINAGFAISIPADTERTIELLKGQKGGLVVTAETSAELVSAAKAAGLPVLNADGSKEPARRGRPRKT